MPDATQVSVGQDALIVNVGADTFTVAANGGSTITTVATGVAVYIYLRTNSTAAGTWRVTTLASTTTTANAASLAGAGLQASAGLLNQEHDIQVQSSNYTVVAGDRATVIEWTGGSGTLTLTAAATLGQGYFFLVTNQGTGTLTIDPNGAETIDAASSKAIAQTESCFVISDGVNWFTVGYGRSSTVSYTRLVKSVAGSSNVTLTAAEAANIIQEYTGILTGNIAVIVPTSIGIYYVFNNTTGAFTLTVRTAAGTGIAVTQATRTILYCDGTNVVSAVASAAGTVTSITAGTGLSGGTITTSGTIAIASSGVSAGTYGSASAVPVLAINAQGQVTSATTATPTATSIGAASATTQIIAGAQLTGGGALSTDRTIALATTAVTPGTYGSTTAAGVFTVNAYGQITSATNATIALPAVGAILIASQTASASASVVFANNLSATYDVYILTAQNVLLDSNRALFVQWGYGGGPTYVTSSYLNARASVNASGTPTDSGTTGGGHPMNGSTNWANSSTGGANSAGGFVYWLTGANGTSRVKSATWQSSYLGTVFEMVTGAGSCEEANTLSSALTSLRIIPDSGGAITSGKFYLYGLKVS